MKIIKILNENAANNIIDKLINFVLALNVKKIKDSPEFQENLNASKELMRIERELEELKPKIRALKNYLDRKGYDDLTLYE